MTDENGWKRIAHYLDDMGQSFTVMSTVDGTHAHGHHRPPAVGAEPPPRGPLHVGQDGIYCNLCPTIVYQTWQLALEHVKLEHPALLALLLENRHLHIEMPR